MKIVERFKKDWRMGLSIINFIAFFFIWFSFKVTSNSEDLSSLGDYKTKFNGFTMLGLSPVAIAVLLIPVVILVLTFVDYKLGEVRRYLFLGLPVLSVIVMFVTRGLATAGFSMAGGGISEIFDSVDMDVKMTIHFGAGFWIALGCNVAMLVFTIVKDFGKAHPADLKGAVRQVSGIARNFGENVSAFAQNVSGDPAAKYMATCPNCGNRVKAGARFCVKCGSPIPEPKPEQKTESQPEQQLRPQQELQPQMQSQPQQELQTKPQSQLQPQPQKKTCKHCHAELEEDALYCIVCGTPVEVEPQPIVCPNCGTENKPEAMFCKKCGSRIGGEQ